MAETLLDAFVVVTCVLATGVACGLDLRRAGTGLHRCLRGLLRRLRLLRAPRRRPAGRPIEQIARDAQRLGRAWTHPRQHLSFARYEGLRRAYDAVLAEGCDALGVIHLLEVLAPGDELDVERVRVERALSAAGLRVDLVG